MKLSLVQFILFSTMQKMLSEPGDIGLVPDSMVYNLHYLRWVI